MMGMDGIFTKVFLFLTGGSILGCLILWLESALNSVVLHFLVCSAMEVVGYEGGLPVGALVSRTFMLCGCAVPLRVCHFGSGKIKW